MAKEVMMYRSEYISVVSEREVMKINFSGLTYEPAPLHGTSIWVKSNEPSMDDPFKRFRKEK
jgi:hypothetical protein